MATTIKNYFTLKTCKIYFFRGTGRGVSRGFQETPGHLSLTPLKLGQHNFVNKTCTLMQQEYNCIANDGTGNTPYVHFMHYTISTMLCGVTLI